MDSFTIGELLADKMVNKRYTIVVRAASGGIFRIQLTDLSRPDPFAPRGHGSVVREVLTSDRETLKNILLRVALAENPLAYCRIIERQYAGMPGVPILIDQKKTGAP